MKIKWLHRTNAAVQYFACVLLKVQNIEPNCGSLHRRLVQEEISLPAPNSRHRVQSKRQVNLKGESVCYSDVWIIVSAFGGPKLQDGWMEFSVL